MASRRSSTRLQTLEGWPSQIGVPITRMSAARYLPEQARPGISPALVALDPRLDVMIDGADDVATRDVVAFQRVQHLWISTSVDDFSSSSIPLREQLIANAVRAMAKTSKVKRKIDGSIPAAPARSRTRPLRILVTGFGPVSRRAGKSDRASGARARSQDLVRGDGQGVRVSDPLPGRGPRARRDF